MAPELVVICCAFAVQVALLTVRAWGRMSALECYRLSGWLMCLVTGAWIGQGSWNAVWAAALAAGWITAAFTEPLRRARAQSMAFNLREWAVEEVGQRS